jgi:hypothetical protein
MTPLPLCGLIDEAKKTTNIGPSSGKPLNAHVSRYFHGRIYLGRFRIVFDTPYDRGERVEFVPAGNEEEPPLDNGECP